MSTSDETLCPNRRTFLRHGLTGAASLLGLPALMRAAEDSGAKPPPIEIADRSALAPTAPVAVERCEDFSLKRLDRVLRRVFDRLGGLRKLVSGKTVTVKLNTTGHGRQRLRGLPAERSFQIHPNMLEVLCGLLHASGAKRIFLVESFYENRSPERIFASQGWNVERIHSTAGHTTKFEDTRNLGSFKDYVKLRVPWGGYVFPAYHVNRRYAETDVLISFGKMKNHVTAGVTGAVKNFFGVTPTSLYGDDAPNESTTRNRASQLHFGTRRVPPGVTEEHHPNRKRLPRILESQYRVPMVTADVFGLRPVDLSIVEGIETCRGGEGPWCPGVHPLAPGLILAGRNGVTVDAIMTALMGYDPLAGATEKPWFGFNHLELLARAGVGTHDPGKIEVVGLPLREALHEFEPGLRGWIKKHAEKG